MFDVEGNKKKHALIEMLMGMHADEVASVFVSYIKKKNEYSRYLALIPEIVSSQYNQIETAIRRGKLVTNALLSFDPSSVKTNITIDNWFVFARTLDFMEDDKTPIYNLCIPTDMLKKLISVLTEDERKRIASGSDDEKKYLLGIVDKLSHKYEMYLADM